MEWIIEDLIILISAIVGYILVISIAITMQKHKVKKNRDTNIEWYGPNVYLKDKVYEGELDVRRDNTSDNRANKINAIGLNNNGSKDKD